MATFHGLAGVTDSAISEEEYERIIKPAIHAIQVILSIKYAKVRLHLLFTLAITELRYVLEVKNLHWLIKLFIKCITNHKMVA